MKEGDVVEIVHRCGRHILGEDPEIYEIGERHTIQSVVRARIRDSNGKYLISDEPALILKQGTNMAVPISAVKLVL